MPGAVRSDAEAGGDHRIRVNLKRRQRPGGRSMGYPPDLFLSADAFAAIIKAVNLLFIEIRRHEKMCSEKHETYEQPIQINIPLEEL